jgi:hypothetical protein
MQDNQDKETNTDEVQSTREYKKIPLGAWMFAAFVVYRWVVQGGATACVCVSLSATDLEGQNDSVSLLRIMGYQYNMQILVIKVR